MKDKGRIYRARAPLRLGLAGGGTDVAPYADDFGGLILNVTINKYAYVTLTVRTDGQVSFRNADSGASWEGSASSKLLPVPALDLHVGVYNKVARELAGNRLLCVDVVTHSEAPPGSGLGSSSTMVVALLKAYLEMLKISMSDYELAQLAFDIERKDLGLEGGKQDQYAAAFGGLNFIEFGRNKVIVNPLRLKPDHRAEIEASLVLYFTGVSRKSADIIHEQVTNMKGGSPSSIEAMHLLKQDALVMKEAILKADYQALAKAMQRSWEAKKRTATSVSNPLIDEVFEAAMGSGALAGKVSGAGGGGFMMFIVDPTRRAEVINKLESFEGTVMTCGFVEYGAHAWGVS